MAKAKSKGTKPKGARGRAQVKKLGRTNKTGGFKKIEGKAAKEYGSKEAGKKVAGAVFQKMAKKNSQEKSEKKPERKTYKGHPHSRVL